MKIFLLLSLISLAVLTTNLPETTEKFLCQVVERSTKDETRQESICLFNVAIGNIDRYETVASISLDEITFVPDSDLTLYEIAGNERILTDFQTEISGNKRYLHWILTGNSKKGTERRYELILEKSGSKTNQSPVSIINSDGGYEFIFNGKKILKYNSQIVRPPKGVDISYSRSGFISPLYAPDQSILTRIPNFNSDHLHHYGLWSAFKKTRFQGKEIDFFAPQFKQGTLRHAGIISMNEGPIFSKLTVLLEHVAWPYTDQETIAISESMEIKVYNNHQGRHLIDLISQYRSMDSLVVEKYNYGGFSFRATDLWTRENTTIFTSEGLNRDEADGKRSKWCVVTGETSTSKVSIEFMSNPLNYNHPEPMRVWPSNVNKGIGNIFINYCPTRNTNWFLSPGNSYSLKYRVLVIDGTINADEAEKAWNEFANPVKTTLLNTDNQ